MKQLQPSRRPGATVTATVIVASGFLLVASAANTSRAGQGDCSQPVSTGPAATATDCLFILQAAVGAQTCTPECICAPTGNLPISATNALFCLSAVVTPGAPLNCPCDTPTSTSTSTTLGGTTTTSTTVGATTTTTLEQCPAQFTVAEAGVAIPCRCLDEGDEPKCDGTCPEFQACRPDFELGGCFCEPLACGDYEGPPECYGLCQDSGDRCVDVDGDCECVDKDNPVCDDLRASSLASDVPVAAVCTAACGDAQAPQCDGGCPDGQFCHDIFSGGCGCVDVTCGSFGGPPICAGVCPPNTACVDFGGTCGCTATIPD